MANMLNLCTKLPTVYGSAANASSMQTMLQFMRFSPFKGKYPSIDRSEMVTQMASFLMLNLEVSSDFGLSWGRGDSYSGHSCLHRGSPLIWADGYILLLTP